MRQRVCALSRYRAEASPGSPWGSRAPAGRVRIELERNGLRRRGIEVPDRADADRGGMGGAGADLIHLVGAHARAARVGRRAARVPGRRAQDPSHRNRFAPRRSDRQLQPGRDSSNVNQFATLSAYVADTSQRTIRLHSSVSLTAENWLLARSIALHAMALQMADAYAEAQDLAEAFGAQVAATPHPQRGLRDRADEMVNILDVYQQRGQGESPFWRRRDRRARAPRAATMDDGVDRAAAAHADLEFATDLPARLELDASEKHASLGSGLQMRLMLPVEPDAAIAQKLNANECVEPDAHQLGAWCVDAERGLMFTRIRSGRRVYAGTVAGAGRITCPPRTTGRARCCFRPAEPGYCRRSAKQ